MQITTDLTGTRVVSTQTERDRIRRVIDCDLLPLRAQKDPKLPVQEHAEAASRLLLTVLTYLEDGTVPEEMEADVAQVMEGK